MTVISPTDPLAVPAGLLADLATYYYYTSYIQVPEFCVFGAIATLTGVAGRAYNTHTGAGLNQYMLLLAPTGTGKDAVASGISKLFNAVGKTLPVAGSTVPAIANFKGPGEIVSSAGLINWLSQRPCIISVVGEFGQRFQTMADPRNPNERSIERTLLQLYGKSGAGEVFDPTARADKDKNTPSIISPSFTLVGEGTPSSFWPAVTEQQIASGLLPRFSITEYEGQRPTANENIAHNPPQALIESFGSITAKCMSLMARNEVHRVPLGDGAYGIDQDFADLCTRQINHGDEVTRQLWNRAHLKFLKLASLSAISRNWINPEINQWDAMWAMTIVDRQTRRIISKFTKGEVGVVDGNEERQLAELIKTIAVTFDTPFSRYSAYGGLTEEMHAANVITETHLSRRLIKLAAFRNDAKVGPTRALKRAFDSLLASDELREIPKFQMIANYQTNARAFQIGNHERFFAALKR